jgi:SpoVK/Ycf46/Vps4 family AAA+-type ATPase
MSDNNEDFSMADFGTEGAEKNYGTKTSEPPQAANEEKSEKKGAKGFCQWTETEPSTFMAVGKTTATLTSGVYAIDQDRGTPIFIQKDVKVDDLIEFPNSKSDRILTEIEDFWKKGSVFKQYGFLHRRGYLLYGDPGGGKTCLVQQVIKRIVKNNGIVFLCGHPNVFGEGLRVYRKVEPDRQIVCILEDVDAIIEQFGEDEILSLMDGENQVDKVINIATTNYPERLDKRITGRPRRFDRIIKIAMPDEAVRRVYFKMKLHIDDNEVEKWVKATKDFSFAAMAELVISVKCLDHPFEKSVDTLKKLMTNKPKSTDSGDEEDEPRKAGFGFS